jgi:hypothetical protein
MPKLLVKVALVSCILSVACGENPAAPDVSFRTVTTGIGGPGVPLQIVRDSATWTSTLARLGVVGPEPPINFSSEMAVVVSRQGGACDRVKVLNVRRHGSGQEVTASFERSECICIAIAAAPYIIIAVPRSTETVTLEWVERTTPCGF